MYLISQHRFACLVTSVDKKIKCFLFCSGWEKSASVLSGCRIWRRVQFCADCLGFSPVGDVDSCRICPRSTSRLCPSVKLPFLLSPTAVCLALAPHLWAASSPLLLPTVNISAVDLLNLFRFSNLPKSILLRSLGRQPKYSFTVLQLLLSFFFNFYTSICAVVQRDLEQTSNKNHDLLEYFPLFCLILSTHIIQMVALQNLEGFWLSLNFIFWFASTQSNTLVAT